MLVTELYHCKLKYMIFILVDCLLAMHDFHLTTELVYIQGVPKKPHKVLLVINFEPFATELWCIKRCAFFSGTPCRSFKSALTVIAVLHAMHSTQILTH